MNNITRFIKTATLTLGLSLAFIQGSCTDKESTITPEVVIATPAFTFPNSGGTETLAIQTNIPIEATSNDASWCTITKVELTSTKVAQYTITVLPNPNTETRSTQIQIKGEGYAGEVSVEQTAGDQMTITNEIKVYEAPTSGGEFTINVQASGDFTIKTTDNWLTISEKNATSVKITVPNNYKSTTRTDTITFTCGNAKATFVVKQAAGLGSMSSDALALVKKIHLGWNLGNSLEVPGNETEWGNPKTTKAIIDMVKNAGFNAVRIPCAWDGYADQTTHVISSTWLARVKEVVDYCIDNGMYTIINIHWDGGWLEEHPLYANQESVNKKQKAYWEQIANYFNDYDEHLLFAGTNEVHADYNEPTVEHYTVQMSYNQTFVDAVRSTGGKNAYRNLIIQSYNTNTEWALKYLNMPTDVVENRLILETHYYSPWDFCGAKSTESPKLYWGKEGGYTNVSTYGQEDYVRTEFGKLKTNFVDKGIPIIMGEYGAVNRSSNIDNETDRLKHQESRAYFLKYVTQKMKEYGIAPFYWDNGPTANDGFGIFNRSNLTVSDQKALDALKQGADAGTYPF
ncbi:endoglucanase [Breznakibacter xylanolyticus]|uniref:Endoglucanase n=1 Tax=Breznakibacter xylanolyticus TaxID=990 RepID=A0A2W7NJC5_9BACT|nr:cellulase family glycosylhydrolase [Breznakibacter xylanolyticus]PZX16814.1 endoglucanase [Breznakibacter xylanolyticus]